MTALTSSTNSASQPLLIMTTAPEFESLLANSIATAIAQYEARHHAERRMTSNEAAQHLGCSLSHLQTLHKQGLAYEKGRPNFYKLSDLEAFRQTRRLQIGQ